MATSFGKTTTYNVCKINLETNEVTLVSSHSGLWTASKERDEKNHYELDDNIRYEIQIKRVDDNTGEVLMDKIVKKERIYSVTVIKDGDESYVWYEGNNWFNYEDAVSLADMESKKDGVEVYVKDERTRQIVWSK